MIDFLRKHILSLTSLGLGLVLILGISLCVGAYSMDLSTIWAAIFGQATEAESFLILNIRLPRILLTAITGAGLAISGAAIQGLFRNPLADQTLIGVSSGAMLFAVLSIVLLGSLLAPFAEIFQQASIAIFAFLGGLISTYVVYFLSRKGGRTQVMTMLLAGIAISAFAGAISGLFIYLSDEQQLRDITFWSMGSFSASSWTQVLISAPLVFLGIAIMIGYADSLNAMLLGESEAIYLGFEVEKIKSRIILITALVVGICIAMSGIIGFVGLIIPHFLRLVRGSDYRYLMKSSALLGASFLLAADTLARTIIIPAELPIGILTATIGAPFFLWLLIKSQKERFLI
ncbi:MAG: iron chelate uptake ABC transporter family permease subunit [Bacteroidota bacterium]